MLLELLFDGCSTAALTHGGWNCCSTMQGEACDMEYVWRLARGALADAIALWIRSCEAMPVAWNMCGDSPVGHWRCCCTMTVCSLAGLDYVVSWSVLLCLL
jgi:hypothetical protein